MDTHLAGFYYDWDTVPGIMLVVQIVLYILKGRLRKKLKQKEYLAKIVEERTIELRIQAGSGTERIRKVVASAGCPLPRHRTNWFERETGYCRATYTRVGGPYPESGELHQ